MTSALQIARTCCKVWVKTRVVKTHETHVVQTQETHVVKTQETRVAKTQETHVVQTQLVNTDQTHISALRLASTSRSTTNENTFYMRTHSICEHF